MYGTKRRQHLARLNSTLSSMTEGDKSQGEQKVVLYNDGATPLYLAIEDADWSQALDLVEENPEQVKTWVRSTGTSNTTFTWSMWKRLPIHEACRRQAPAWLVSALFSVYPESAYETTQFGELPLHLAVESGAAPEVVNLIMVANWSAIVTADNSGRNPTDILDRGELLLLDEHRIVHESLARCHKAYTEMQKSAQDEKAELTRTHKRELAAIERNHSDALVRERQEQERIGRDVKELKAEIESLNDALLEKDRLLHESRNETQTWKEKAEALYTVIDLLRNELDGEKAKIVILNKDLEARQDDIRNCDDMIEVLSNDIRTISLIHDRDLMESVRASERAMRAMVSSQIALQKQLTGQANGIKNLMKARGINLHPVSSTPKQEEKEHADDCPVDANDAATALAAAAMAALKPSLSAHSG